MNTISLPSGWGLKHRLPSKIWISDKQVFFFLSIRMSQILHGNMLKNYSLFFWNLDLTDHPAFLLAKSHHPNPEPTLLAPALYCLQDAQSATEENEPHSHVSLYACMVYVSHVYIVASNPHDQWAGPILLSSFTDEGTETQIAHVALARSQVKILIISHLQVALAQCQVLSKSFIRIYAFQFISINSVG